MQQKVRTFRALSGPERRLVVGISLLYPWIELALRLRGLRRTQALFARWIPARPIQDGLTPATINLAVRRAAGAGPYRATCLRQSLVLWWLLQRRGVACAIKIGAANHVDGFKAHAWVEWDGGQSDSAQRLKHFTVFKPLTRSEPEQR